LSNQCAVPLIRGRKPTRIGAMLCCESSPGVQPGCGLRLALRRFREFSKRGGVVADNAPADVFECRSYPTN
jgi:hypothetical protein